MLDFLKERILLFALVLAGDWVSLAAFIKADEIRHDAITIAIAVSLIPSLIISLIVAYFFKPKRSKKKFVLAAIIVSILFWSAFILCYLNFSNINNKYGKIALPVSESVQHPKDSIIVGGCHYTIEAQAEVDTYAAKHRTLTPAVLLADFNYDVSQVWSEAERDCARSKILQAFALMLLFLTAGITLTCEILISGKKDIVPPAQKVSNK
jgi:hypothetical protein